MTLDLTLVLPGILIVLITILPLWRVGLWWIRIFDFPCAQLAFLNILLISIWLWGTLNENDLMFSTGVMPFLAASLVIQGYRIHPYTVFVKQESPPHNHRDPARTFSILCANVLMKNRSFEKLLRCIEQYNPDLILLTETNHQWENALQSLEKNYPYTIKKPLENTYGMHMYSRLPLVDTNIRFLVEDDVPSFQTTIQIPSGDTVDFYGLHPRPPRINQDTHERDAELLIVGRLIAEQPRPAIVAGDLNDVAWSHTTRLFRELSGLLDPRIGRGFLIPFQLIFLYSDFLWTTFSIPRISG
ncbi:endonuclease/exonuclease/phosphatase family protein [Nitrospira sp. M1]